MKAILFLCLLAFMTCEKDIIDIGKCIYKAPKVQELISDVIVAIATQDFTKLLPKIKEALPELIQIVLGCIIDDKAVEDSKFEMIPPWYICDYQCRGKYHLFTPEYNKCFEACKKNVFEELAKKHRTS